MSAPRAAAARPHHGCARPRGYYAARGRSKACSFISTACCGVSTACCRKSKAAKQRSPAPIRGRKAKERAAQATNRTKTTRRQPQTPHPAATKQLLTEIPRDPRFLKYVLVNVKSTTKRRCIDAQNHNRCAALCFFTPISPGPACHHFLENAKDISAAPTAGRPPTGHDKTAGHVGDRPPHAAGIQPRGITLAIWHRTSAVLAASKRPSYQ